MLIWWACLNVDLVIKKVPIFFHHILITCPLLFLLYYRWKWLVALTSIRQCAGSVTEVWWWTKRTVLPSGTKLHNSSSQGNWWTLWFPGSFSPLSTSEHKHKTFYRSRAESVNAGIKWFCVWCVQGRSVGKIYYFINFFG